MPLEYLLSLLVPMLRWLLENLPYLEVLLFQAPLKDRLDLLNQRLPSLQASLPVLWRQLIQVVLLVH